jgi:hypothetical protein
MDYNTFANKSHNSYEQAMANSHASYQLALEAAKNGTATPEQLAGLARVEAAINPPNKVAVVQSSPNGLGAVTLDSPPVITNTPKAKGLGAVVNIGDTGKAVIQATKGPNSQSKKVVTATAF